jgi:hypothetical protein
MAQRLHGDSAVIARRFRSVCVVFALPFRCVRNLCAAFALRALVVLCVCAAFARCVRRVANSWVCAAFLKPLGPICAVFALRSSHARAAQLRCDSAAFVLRFRSICDACALCLRSVRVAYPQHLLCVFVVFALRLRCIFTSFVLIFHRTALQHLAITTIQLFKTPYYTLSSQHTKRYNTTMHTHTLGDTRSTWAHSSS